MNPKEVIEDIFKEIDEAIEKSITIIPVELKKSNFLRSYNSIKLKYLKK